MAGRGRSATTPAWMSGGVPGVGEQSAYSHAGGEAAMGGPYGEYGQGGERGRDRSRSPGRGGHAYDATGGGSMGHSGPAPGYGGYSGGGDAYPSQPDARADRRWRRNGKPSQWDVGPGGFFVAPGSGMNPPMPPPGAPADQPPPMPAMGPVSQQTRHARRLYVGGIGKADERDLTEFFNDVVGQALVDPVPDGMSPVLSVYVNTDRNFAFVEFATIELATACMALDGLIFRENPVRVRRPNDYNPTALPPGLAEKMHRIDISRLPMSLTAPRPGAPGPIAASVPCKVFVGGLPNTVTESSLQALFSSVGPVKNVNILRDHDGAPKGYGFIEFTDPSFVEVAITQLNGFVLEGRALTVNKANPPGTGSVGGGPLPGMMPGGGPLPMMPGMLPGMMPGMMPPGFPGMPGAPSGLPSMPGLPGMMPGLMAPGMIPPAALAGTSSPPSRILCLQNMFSEDELQTDYDDILEDIRDECQKFGELISVVIPRPGEPGVGKAYLEYRDMASATAAIQSLHGRKFEDNLVQATYFDEAKFNSRSFA